MLVNSGVPLHVWFALNRLKVRNPLGLDPLDRTARSLAQPAVVVSIMLEGDAAVVTVGLARRTVRVSPVAPQGAMNPLLLASPLYEATQLYVPGTGLAKDAD